MNCEFCGVALTQNEIDSYGIACVACEETAWASLYPDIEEAISLENFDKFRHDVEKSLCL